MMNKTAVHIDTQLYNIFAEYARRENTSVDKMLERLIMTLPQMQVAFKKEELTPEQERRMALVDELAGAFSACQTIDWKKEKEEYLEEKYGL